MKYCPNCGAEVQEGATFCEKCGASMTVQQQTVQQPQQPAAGGEQKSKMAAGLLGIFLGSLGIHNFYLGYTTKAIVQLLVTLLGGVVTCGLASVAVYVWGLVEGIMILTGSINTDANGNPLKD